MTHSATLDHRTVTGPRAAASPLLQRLTAWWRGAATPATTTYTRDDAASLYARAASYERTQPGFAADLRAAAEGLECIEAGQAR